MTRKKAGAGGKEPSDDLPFHRPAVARLAQEALATEPARKVEQYITRLYADQIEWIKARPEAIAARRGERANAAEFLREVLDAVIQDWELAERAKK
jgi:hypothetical protein